MRAPLRRSGLLTQVLAAALIAAVAPKAFAQEESVEASICRIIETAAKPHNLPVLFLTRLIWKESNFRADAVSPVGAQGIAQFMPGTANERGLANPFDPEAAIPKAAHLLADLRGQFGNLGLAAAAYNAGPRRVSNWIAGTGGMPIETQDYVASITRHSVEEWRDGGAKLIDSEVFPEQTCGNAMIAIRREGGRVFAGVRVLAPWGVQLAGNFSKSLALAGYGRAQRSYPEILRGLEPMVLGRRLRSRGRSTYYQVRTPSPTRGAAEALCARIRGAGGACIVLKS